MVEGEAVQANNAVDVKAIYEMLRQKKMATTSAVNIEQFLEIFEGIVKEDLDILYLGFSSGLSGTFSASAVAMRELSEKYPDRKLYAVDTLCASMGQGLLVYYAAKLKEGGADIDAVKDYVESNKLVNLVTLNLFTVAPKAVRSDKLAKLCAPVAKVIDADAAVARKLV